MKKRVAFVIAYDGRNYFGSQCSTYDIAYPTVTGKFMEALLSCGLISACNFPSPAKIGFHSASRTDKHVSAVCNVFQVKVTVDVVVDPGIIKKLAVALAESGIHLYNVLSVTKSFVPHKFVQKRVYDYWIPTFLLAYDGLAEVDFNVFVSRMRGFRTDPLTVTGFETLASRFCGSHSFHNFTTHKKDLPDPRRVINSVSIPHLRVVDDIEYAMIQIDGNSFIIHQIRKMIAFILFLHSRLFSSSVDSAFQKIFDETFSCCLPCVPGNYLLLSDIVFWSKKFKNAEGEFVLPAVDQNEKCDFYSRILDGICDSASLAEWYCFFQNFNEHMKKSFSSFCSQFLDSKF